MCLAQFSCSCLLVWQVFFLSLLAGHCMLIFWCNLGDQGLAPVCGVWPWAVDVWGSWCGSLQDSHGGWVEGDRMKPRWCQLSSCKALEGPSAGAEPALVLSVGDAAWGWPGCLSVEQYFTAVVMREEQPIPAWSWTFQILQAKYHNEIMIFSSPAVISLPSKVPEHLQCLVLLCLPSLLILLAAKTSRLQWKGAAGPCSQAQATFGKLGQYGGLALQQKWVSSISS